VRQKPATACYNRSFWIGTVAVVRAYDCFARADYVQVQYRHAVDFAWLVGPRPHKDCRATQREVTANILRPSDTTMQT
jgi:hypothetical protein